MAWKLTLIVKTYTVALLIVIGCALLLTACGEGPHAIRGGALRNPVFSVEPRANGFFTIWFYNDDVGAYCTNSAAVVAKARAIMISDQNEAVALYASINTNDPEFGSWVNPGSGCASETKNNIVYRLIDIMTVAEAQASATAAPK